VSVPIFRRLLYFLNDRVLPLRLWWEVRGKSPDEVAKYYCNICSTDNLILRSRMLSRESLSCRKCRSSLRRRSVVNAISLCLFGEPLKVKDFPNDSRKGVGLSDDDGVSKRLGVPLNYHNTFYHKEPFLDIQNIEINQEGTIDYIVCSEVLEHVIPPIENALMGIYKLLKKDGFVIITVPYNSGGSQDGPVIEHFPDLNEFELIRKGDYKQGGIQHSQVLVNITKEGARQEFTDLSFHGGPGLNLEMRQFTKKSLIDLLISTGFSRVETIDSDFSEFGIEFVGEYRGLVDKEPVVAWK